MLGALTKELNSILERDPAAGSKWEIFLFYPGFKAVRAYRLAHWLYGHHCRFLALWLTARARRKTGIEIHPGARIGKNLFIDHGMGVVIGETAVIGDNCTLYQQVTLGAGRACFDACGKRHPTLGNNVLVGAGAKVLGPFTVGDHAKIAAGAVVLKAVPPGATVAGVPAKIKKINAKEQ